jgi:hypothetical protein
MDLWVIILRLAHVGGAVIWAGFGLFTILYLGPAVKATGPAGGQIMGYLVGKTRFTVVMMVAALLTILSGLILYWRDSGGLNMNWLKTGQGIMFTIGGIAGIAAAVVGGAMIGPTQAKMGRLSQQLVGAPPSAEQVGQLQAMQARINTANNIVLVTLLVALVCMAIARYV